MLKNVEKQWCSSVYSAGDKRRREVRIDMQKALTEGAKANPESKKFKKQNKEASEGPDPEPITCWRICSTLPSPPRRKESNNCLFSLSCFFSMSLKHALYFNWLIHWASKGTMFYRYYYVVGRIGMCTCACGLNVCIKNFKKKYKIKLFVWPVHDIITTSNWSNIDTAICCSNYRERFNFCLCQPQMLRKCKHRKQQNT